jgi:hypothetical protein
LEACRRQGIKPSELVMKSMEQLKQMYREKAHDKSAMDIMARHYEERRKEKIRILLEVYLFFFNQKEYNEKN